MLLDLLFLVLPQDNSAVGAEIASSGSEVSQAAVVVSAVGSEQALGGREVCAVGTVAYAFSLESASSATETSQAFAIAKVLGQEAALGGSEACVASAVALAVGGESASSGQEMASGTVVNAPATCSGHEYASGGSETLTPGPTVLTVGDVQTLQAIYQTQYSGYISTARPSSRLLSLGYVVMVTDYTAKPIPRVGYRITEEGELYYKRFIFQPGYDRLINA